MRKENLSDYILAIQTIFVLLNNFSIRRLMIKDTFSLVWCGAGGGLFYYDFDIEVLGDLKT